MIAYRSISLFIAFLLATTVYAQVEKMESLLERLPHLQGTEKIEVLLQLAERSLRTSLDDASQYAEEALQLSLELQEDTTLAKAYEVKGKTDFFRGDMEMAITSFKQGLLHAKMGKDSLKVAYLQNSLGLMYKKQGAYDHALLFFYRAYRNLEETQNTSKLVTALMNIGSVYFHLKQYQKAIDMYHRVTPILESNKDMRRLGNVYNNLGDVYFEQKKYDISLELYRKSLAIKFEHKLHANAANTLKNIGSLYFATHKLDSANVYYDKALELINSKRSKILILQVYEGKGDIAMEKSQWAKALEYYEKSLALAETSKALVPIAKLNENISKLYARTGQYEKAYQYNLKFTKSRDSLQIKENQKKLADLEKEFESKDELKQVIFELEKKKEVDKWKMYMLSMLLIFFVVGLVGLYSRFQHRKKAHALLKSKNRDIKDKNKLLEKHAREISEQNHKLTAQSEEIQVQNQLLQQSNTDLEQFAYVASHDLREPLRTIRSYLQLLEKRYIHQLDSNALEFIDYAVNGAERMDGLLRELLNYSRIGREVISKKEVDLNVIMDQVLYNLNGQIEENQAIIETEPLPIVFAYEIQMRQLLQNLLSNAIKFRKEIPPHIFVRVRKYAERYVISIQDNGIGINPKYQEKVFTIFQRLHSQAQYKGTGIGLSICKRISQNHGGDLWFESEPGKGATFFVSLCATHAKTPQINP